MSTKTLYLVTLFALAAVAAAGFLLVPTNNTVSAQDNVISAPAQVSHEVLTSALNFRTATEFAVLGEKGIIDNGGSKIGGDVGVGVGAQIRGLRSDNVKGMLRSGEGAEKVQKDFASSFNYLNQLPCTEVADTNLGGKTFTPGVYCLSSADLAGQVVLNSDDANGIFIFRLAGSLTTQGGSGMQLLNQAKAYNVFFVANDSATVAENTNFSGTILAKNNINVRSGSTVTGRTLSLNGSVELENATVALQVGFLEICKTANGTDAGNTNGGLAGRLFSFTVGGQTLTAPVGGCTRPFSVATGPITITENLVNTDLAGNNALNGRFVLTSVTETGPGTLGAVNLQLRTASVTVTEGAINNQTVVTFNNQFAVVGFVEICKIADDAGVGGATTGTTGGIFQFQIDNVFTGNLGGTNGTTRTLQTFSVPVGMCTGLIAVPTALGAGSGTTGAIRTSVDVREIVPSGTTFVGAFTVPADRLIAVNTTNVAVQAANGDATATNAGTTSLLAGTSVRAVLVEGSGTTGAANQTTIFFRNRSDATLKVCKTNGGGIPAGTQFVFQVQGTAAVVPAVGGEATGATGAAVNTNVTVLSGSCSFVTVGGTGGTGPTIGTLQRFQTGTSVTVTETGVITGQQGTGGAFTIGNVTGSVQASQIINLNGTTSTVNLGGTATTGTTANPTLAGRSIRFNIIAGTNEVEFVNFIFNQALLKICKVAGAGVSVGEVFTFNVTTVGANGANVTNQVLVQAGPADQGGFCQFASGPFTNTGSFGTGTQNQTGGFFNVGATVTVTEVLAANSGITTTITSPTASAGTTNSSGVLVGAGLSVTGTTGTFTGTGGIIFGTGGAGSIATNEIVFTNTRTATATPTPGTGGGGGTATPTPGTGPGGGGGTATPTPGTGPGGTATQTPLPVIPPLRPGKKGGSRLMSSF